MAFVDVTRVPRVLPADLPSPPSFIDPNFRRAADWLAGGTEDNPGLLVLGAPYAGGSISRAHCDGSPSAIRKALERFSTYSSDFDTSVDRLRVFDVGNLPRAVGASVEEYQQHITEALVAIRAQTNVPVALLGGDNSITVGGFHGSGADALITFDAHHDVREWDDLGPMNGSPVRQVIESGVPGSNVVQIGLHGFTNAETYARYAAESGITGITAHSVRTIGVDAIVEEALLKLETAGATSVWVDIDLDCLERAVAPAAPASMPGGLMPADLERAAFRLGHSPMVTGLDITELDPTLDVADSTVRAACSVLLSFACGVAIRA